MSGPGSADDSSTGADAGESMGATDESTTGQVEACAHAELAAPGRVQVPRDVGLDRVEPQQPRLVEPVGPLLRVDAEVVQSAGDDAERSVVETKAVCGDLQSWHGCS